MAKHGFTEAQQEHLDTFGLRNKSGWPQLWRGVETLTGNYTNTASKTAAFAATIAEPETCKAVCIDSHMGWAWIGAWAHGSSLAFADSVYADIAGAVAEMAAKLGLLPSQVQAILWLVRKRILDNSEQASPGWVDAWIECKYAGHAKYDAETNRMPDYNLDRDLAQEYGSITNLWWLWEQATKDEIIAGMDWYRQAHKDTLAAAYHTGVDFGRMCQCVSALSPGRSWEYNIWAAQTLAEQAQALGII